ncbi:hypothetical protein LCGC14_2144040, partial [marine sediment metagenome]
SVIVECKPTRQVLEQIKECVAFRDNFSEEFRRFNEIDLDKFIYDEIFKCADKIIKMMVKKAYEDGYKRLNRRVVIGLAIFQACKLLDVNIFQSYIGNMIN